MAPGPNHVVAEWIRIWTIPKKTADSTQRKKWVSISSHFMARKRLGELLLERGVLTQPQLDACLATQKQTRQRLGVLLVEKGYITEADLTSALSEALGVALAILEPPDWTAVHMLRPRFCEQNDLFPFGITRTGGRKQLLVAMADPLNTPAIQEIEFTTGLVVGVRLAALSTIRSAIVRYHHKGQGQPSPSSDDVIVGEELAPEAPPAELQEDLAFLFGTAIEPPAVEKLEKKFWALMRVLARKGIVSKEDFARELNESDE